MARVKINIPDKKPLFTTQIPIRITDMNYGNHLGNDRILAIAQEARVQWLKSIGHSELDIGGCGLIMADAMVTYRNEGLYGDLLNISIFSSDTSTVSFDLLFQVTTQRQDKEILIAQIKTGMVAFDYAKKQVVSIPASFIEKLS